MSRRNLKHCAMASPWRRPEVRKGPLTIQSDTDVAVDGVAGLSIELLVDLASGRASTYGVKVCASPDRQEETSIFYAARENLLKVDTTRSGPEDTPRPVEAGPFELKDGERPKLRIFVDRSVVEVFANSRQAVPVARESFLPARATGRPGVCHEAGIATGERTMTRQAKQKVRPPRIARQAIEASALLLIPAARVRQVREVARRARKQVHQFDGRSECTSRRHSHGTTPQPFPRPMRP